MKRFALGMLCGVGGTMALIAATFLGLIILTPGNVPPPAISQIVHLDMKLRYLRAHPGVDPEVLAAGSSITWRQLSGDTIEKILGAPATFWNGGTAYLKVHQTRALVRRFYLPAFSNVHTVVMMTNLPDFEDCTKEPATVLNAKDAKRYAFDHWPAAFFYVRYFSPARYVRTALNLEGRLEPFQGDLFLDAYGSGPIEISRQRAKALGLRFGAIRIDPACTAALIGFSKDMTTRGIHLVVVFPPIHPTYRDRYPESVRALRAVIQEVKQAVADDDTEVLAMDGDRRFVAADFYDAFHLQWPAALRLSQAVAIAVKADETEPSMRTADPATDDPSTILPTRHLSN